MAMSAVGGMLKASLTLGDGMISGPSSRSSPVSSTSPVTSSSTSLPSSSETSAASFLAWSLMIDIGCSHVCLSPRHNLGRGQWLSNEQWKDNLIVIIGSRTRSIRSPVTENATQSPILIFFFVGFWAYSIVITWCVFSLSFHTSSHVAGCSLDFFFGGMKVDRIWIRMKQLQEGIGFAEKRMILKEEIEDRGNHRLTKAKGRSERKSIEYDLLLFPSIVRCSFLRHCSTLDRIDWIDDECSTYKFCSFREM